MIDYKSNIWKFYVYKIFMSIELTISIFVLFLLGNNLSMTQIMLLETIFMFLILVLEVPSGAFADFYGRKLSMQLGLFFWALGFIVFGFSHTFFNFLLGNIFVAFSWSLVSGADSALLYDSLKEINLEKQYSKIYGRGNFFSILTWSSCALISSILAVHLGYRILFFLTAAITLIGIIFSFSIKEPPIHKTLHEKNYFKHILSAVKFSYNHKVVKNLIIYYGMFAAFGHLSWFLIQPYYDQTSLPKYILGVAMFLFFIPAAIGNLTAEKFLKKIKEENLLLLMLLLAALTFAGIFYVSPLIALILISINSFVCGMRDIFVSKGINEHTSSHHRATVISVQSMSKSIMYALFAPLIGYFTDMFSPAAAFLMLGISLLLFFIYYYSLHLISKQEII